MTDNGGSRRARIGEVLKLGMSLDRRLLLGRCLRQVRENRGWSQKHAARAAGIHPVQLARIEAGTANFAISTLFAMAMAYEIDVDKLFDENGPTIDVGANPTKPLRRKTARTKGRSDTQV